MGFEDLCNTVLSLGLPSMERPKDHQYFHQQKNTKTSSKSDHFFPSLTLALSSDDQVTIQRGLTFDASKVHGELLSKSKSKPTVLYRQASSISGVSSFSNSSVKREIRDTSSEEVEAEEEERVCSKVISDDQDDEEELGGARKKLRLTKDQSLILEDNFKEHSTLNPNQKQALAKRLNLRPRQVEVWFQNRRARTKLKQTEVDCELLKKCCEKLTDENRRLLKELQELKTLKRATPPFYMQLPAATLSICPSCERIGGSVSHHENSSKSPFSINNTKPQFYGPFINTHPSAAC